VGVPAQVLKRLLCHDLWPCLRFLHGGQSRPFR
jgi:hypothetical protein